MRTTVDLPDDLLRRARDAALKRGLPLKEYLHEAIAEKLARLRIADLESLDPADRQ